MGCPARGLALIALSMVAGVANEVGRKTTVLDRGWRFARFGLMPDGTMRPEPQPSPERSDFDDAAWRTLDIPHDWGIEGPFLMDRPNETGKLPWEGIGWYRRRIDVASAAAGRRFYLDFDGAMSQPKIYVNGVLAGEWKYGYSSFRVEITHHLRFGQANVLAVRLDNPPESSRWYPGGGLYRHVRLVETGPVAIDHWGVKVTTPRIEKDRATVCVETALKGNTQGADVSVTLHRRDGNTGQAGPALVMAKGVKAELRLLRPHRWDVHAPHLYIARVSVRQRGRVVDQLDTVFGVRSAQWDAQKGFLLNGRALPLQGVCQHHDLGALGAAVNARAVTRQVELLKEMGVNAIRTSHNPPAPELLEACDRLGVVVIDELFDAWRLAKKPQDYHLHYEAWHEKDLRNLVLRDRNHPCVIAWSTGNEVEEISNAKHHDVPAKLYRLFRELDPTRPVTAGSNQPQGASNGFQQHVDLYGVNYHLGSYAATAKANPDKPLYSSESSSCVSTRGDYFFPVSWEKNKGFYDFQVSSYDLYAPGWANRPDLQFEALDQYPRYAGEFVWTGFDYLGEPTPYNQDSTNALNFQSPEARTQAMAEMQRLGNRAPSRSSYFGILDLAGFKKDRFYLYQARWRPDLPMAHLLPHWNWPERVGQVTPVHLYTSGDAAELFLNGRSLGTRTRGALQYRMTWDEVVFEPGELRAVVTKGGKPWAQDVVRTTGAAKTLALEPDRATFTADGQDLSFVTVRVVDAAGLTVPRAKHALRFSLEGPGEIVAVDNGDPVSFEPFQAKTRKAFNGLALVIVKGRARHPGTLHLRAEGEGLAPSTTTLHAR